MGVSVQIWYLLWLSIVIHYITHTKKRSKLWFSVAKLMRHLPCQHWRWNYWDSVLSLRKEIKCIICKPANVSLPLFSWRLLKYDLTVYIFAVSGNKVTLLRSQMFRASFTGMFEKSIVFSIWVSFNWIDHSKELWKLLTIVDEHSLPFLHETQKFVAFWKHDSTL